MFQSLPVPKFLKNQKLNPQKLFMSMYHAMAVELAQLLGSDTSASFATISIFVIDAKVKESTHMPSLRSDILLKYKSAYNFWRRCESWSQH